MWGIDEITTSDAQEPVSRRALIFAAQNEASIQEILEAHLQSSYDSWGVNDLERLWWAKDDSGPTLWFKLVQRD
jgi:hypothetical protein